MNYDFHKWTANGFDEPLFKLTQWLKKNELTGQEYYSLFGQEQRLNQKGVGRTNCLDCLDRTNIVQAEIACSTVRTMLDAIKKYEME